MLGGTRSHGCSGTPTYRTQLSDAKSLTSHMDRRRKCPRQRDRVVKVMDYKSIGLCPQGFESPRCRTCCLAICMHAYIRGLRVASHARLSAISYKNVRKALEHKMEDCGVSGKVEHDSD